MPTVEALHDTNDAVFATFGDIFIVVWRTQTTQSLVRAMGRHVERFAANHPNGISMIVVIEEQCAMPDAATRDVMATDMKRHDSFTRFMTLVHEGTGFRAAALRSIVAGLHVLSRQRVSTKVVDTVAHAADWLAPKTTFGSSEIVAAVAEVRARRTV